MNKDKTTLLHSRYNPKAEAERYIDSLSLNENIRFCILIEPGLGYMIPPLKKKLPGAKIIVLHAEYANSTETSVSVGADVSVWVKGKLSVQDFLEREIPDTKAEAIRLIEWRPALSVYGSAYRTLVEEAVNFIKRSDANYRTTKAFGETWFKNFFKNINLIRQAVIPGSITQPVLVTGAGPGLEKAISLFSEECLQKKLFILAVSSSASALEARGIKPNLLISTDGGEWAKFHLYNCFRAEKQNIPLAAAMTAALPSQCANIPILPISDGSLWQTTILNELKIPFITLPQRGTVTAAALDLGFTLTKAEVYITGFDLANNDIRSHARPYGLDRFIEDKENRLSPVYSRLFNRSSMLKDGKSYEIYAAWFKNNLGCYPKRLYALGENNEVFNSLKSVKSFPAITPDTSFNFKTQVIKGDCVSAEKAYSILEKHLTKLQEELAALFWPGREKPSLDELMERIRSLSGQCRGAANG